MKSCISNRFVAVVFGGAVLAMGCTSAADGVDGSAESNATAAFSKPGTATTAELVAMVDAQIAAFTSDGTAPIPSGYYRPFLAMLHMLDDEAPSHELAKPLIDLFLKGPSAFEYQGMYSLLQSTLTTGHFGTVVSREEIFKPISPSDIANLRAMTVDEARILAAARVENSFTLLLNRALSDSGASQQIAGVRWTGSSYRVTFTGRDGKSHLITAGRSMLVGDVLNIIVGS